MTKWNANILGFAGHILSLTYSSSLTTPFNNLKTILRSHAVQKHCIKQISMNIKELKAYKVCSLPTMELNEESTERNLGETEIFGN